MPGRAIQRGEQMLDMLDDIKLDTVDMQPNYDDRLLEPTVLPGKFPNLLVNGGVGIAVGMATCLAPHNVVEVLDSIVRVLDEPEIPLTTLMEDVKDAEGKVIRRGIKGPDFPTGGLIVGRRGVLEAYATGRGRNTLRGKVHVEPIPGSRDRQQIVIDEVPYGLNQETLVQRIRDADFDVSDLTNLLRMDQRPDVKDLIRRVTQGYRFLADLSELDRALIADRKGRRRDLADEVLQWPGEPS